MIIVLLCNPNIQFLNKIMSASTDEVPYTIINRGDGVLVVRVHSQTRQGRRLPDTSFTFKPGDPQYESWQRIYNENHPDAPVTVSAQENNP